MSDVKNLHIPKCHDVDNRRDNWRHFDYDRCRYLDAVASLFSINQCAAVAEKQNVNVQEEIREFWLSFNKSITSDENSITLKKRDLISHALNCTNQVQRFKKLIAVYTLLNTDFLRSVKHCESLRELVGLGEFRENLNRYYERMTDFNDDIRALGFMTTGFDSIYEKIFDNYREMESYVMRNFANQNYSHLPPVVECLVRPKQDIVKIMNVIISQNIRNPVFEILSNEDKKHAERNIRDHQPASTYIGVSKLSCASCYDYITKCHNQNIVRGTSGLLFRDRFIYKFPHSEDMKETINRVKDLEKHPFCENKHEIFRRQRRSLSFNDEISPETEQILREVLTESLTYSSISSCDNENYDEGIRRCSQRQNIN